MNKAGRSAKRRKPRKLPPGEVVPSASFGEVVGRAIQVRGDVGDPYAQIGGKPRQDTHRRTALRTAADNLRHREAPVPRSASDRRFMNLVALAVRCAALTGIVVLSLGFLGLDAGLTQQVEQTYAIRSPQSAKDAIRESPLVSEFRFDTLDENGDRLTINVEFHTFVENGHIIYQIHRNPSDLIISLGGMRDIVGEEARQLIKKQVIEFGGELIEGDFNTLFLHPGMRPSEIVEISIPANDVGYGTGMMMVFDEHGHLLATGQYLFLVPHS